MVVALVLVPVKRTFSFKKKLRSLTTGMLLPHFGTENALGTRFGSSLNRESLNQPAGRTSLGLGGKLRLTGTTLGTNGEICCKPLCVRYFRLVGTTGTTFFLL